MSADNAIVILKTIDHYKLEGRHTLINTFGQGIAAYRVAEIQTIDNFHYLQKHEIHNLGYWMYCNFSQYDVFYSEVEAKKVAEELYNSVGYVEYGIVKIDASEYNFPGC